MSRVLLLASAALLGLASLPTLHAPALAQTDPAAMDLIQRLRPTTGSGTRGIRMPGSDVGTATPAAPAVPAAAAAPPVATSQPRVAPAPVRETTAPAGVAAASLTVNFPSGSSSLTPAAMAAIAPLGRALNDPQLADFRFRIEGHTDTVGDETGNRALSQRRAEAVRDYLVRQFGIAPARLEAVGLGETQLLVATPDQMAEPRNRRVQVLNLGS